MVEVDPLWAKQYLESHQELKQAIDRFPKGHTAIRVAQAVAMRTPCSSASESNSPRTCSYAMKEERRP